MFAERFRKGSWSDPNGAGRCPRCKTWLKDPQIMVWMVIQRSDGQPLATIDLCADCTAEVLTAWRATPPGKGQYAQ